MKLLIVFSISIYAMSSITAYGEVGKPSTIQYPGTLTKIQFDDVNPIWSPDGQTIAFERIYKGGTIKSGIYIFEPLTNKLVIPICESGSGTSSGFSFDLNDTAVKSKKDFYSSYFCWISIEIDKKKYKTYKYAYSKVPHLYVGRVSANPALPFTEAPFVSTETGQNKYPDYSSQQNMIAFVSGITGAGDIYAKKYDESYTAAQSSVDLSPGKTRLTDVDALDLSPRWSPNGEHIVYSSLEHGNMDIYVLLNALKEKVKKRLTGSRLEETIPTWSPDGRFVAFYTLRAKSSADEKDVFDLCVVEVDKGLESAKVAASNVYRQERRGPVWMKLPDNFGLNIIYTSDDYKGIHIVNVDKTLGSGQPDITDIKSLRGYEYGNITDVDCAQYKQEIPVEQQGIWIAYSALNKSGQKRLYVTNLMPDKSWEVREEYSEPADKKKSTGILKD